MWTKFGESMLGLLCGVCVFLQGNSFLLFCFLSSGIDYPRLLEILPAEWGEHPSKVVWTQASDLSIVYFVTFIAFCKVLRGVWGIPGNPAAAHVLPVGLLFWFVYRVVVPWKERKGAWFMLWRVLAAPAYEVSFRDGYVGDILTSTVRVCIDLAFACIYAGLVSGHANISLCLGEALMLNSS